MPSIVALQMDPIGSINPASDTTYRLGLEAQARGFALFCYTREQLAWRKGEVLATGHFVTLHNDPGHYYTPGEPGTLNLAEADFVLMRQDPPFDMGYISATYLLERLPKTTRVINDPAAVRNWPEKLSILDYPQFIPPTLVSRDRTAIEQFRKAQGDVVIKPLYGFGGQNIVRCRDGEALEPLLAPLLNGTVEPVMVQAFLPMVADSEKRVLIIDGKAEAVINRIPPAGDFIANLCHGGSAAATELTQREAEIAAIVGARLKSVGILLAGLDLIGGHLTEINVTSPTGFAPAEALYGINLAKIFWDAVL